MKTEIITLLTAAAIMTACNGKDNEFDATGTFEATEITVSALETGQIMRLNAEEGTVLKEGQQAGLIDTVQLALSAIRLGATRESIANSRPDIQAQIAATRQQIEKAEMEKRRFEKLVGENAANRKQLDDAESTLKVLQRQLQAQLSTLGNSTRSLDKQMSATEIQRMQILDRLNKCRIMAPVSGTVIEKYAEQGEFATTGKPLFKIADTRRMYLRAYITSDQLADVKIGQKAKVTCDYGNNKGKTYDGTVTWISQKSEFTPKTILTDDERADLVYAVKVAIDNDGGAKIGMYGKVKFLK